MVLWDILCSVRYRMSTMCSPYITVDSTRLTAALDVCYGAITLPIYMTSTRHRLSSQLYFNIHYNFKVSLINLLPHIAAICRATHPHSAPGFNIFTLQGNAIAVVSLQICVALRSHLWPWPPASIKVKLLTAKTKVVREIVLHIRDENSLNLQYCLHLWTKEGSHFVFVLFARYRRLAHLGLATFFRSQTPKLIKIS
jgi:hypothetical protein